MISFNSEISLDWQNDSTREKLHKISLQVQETIEVLHMWSFTNQWVHSGISHFVALNWSSKSRKRHRCLPNYDQGERIRERYSFVKNITTKIVLHNLSILINILFHIFFLLFCLHHRTFAKFVRTEGFSKWILIHGDTSRYI